MSAERRFLAGSDPLSPTLAGATVFFASGTVLVLEILGVRLLAPFVGASLNTYTAIIGTVLAGISLGTYAGGQLADRYPPIRLLGPALLLSGATSLMTIPLIRLFGGVFDSATPANAVLLSFVALFFPAAFLSAVSPIVVKRQLLTVAKTGRTVGQLSAIGTAGSIFGTFFTGFVLLTYFRVSLIVVVIGTALVMLGVLITIAAWDRRARNLLPIAAVVMFAGGPLTLAEGDYCEAESKYYCMRLLPDERGSETGKYLVLDNLSHSYVDTKKPTELRFWYVQAMATVLDTLQPQDGVRTLTVGGGGFTLPRYLSETRSQARTTAMEIDPKLVTFNREKLGLDSIDRLDIREGDARSTTKTLPDASYDFIVADAFGNESVPWHLSTVEFNQDLRRVASDDAVLVLNVIDYGSRDLLKAEIKTLQQVWPHVALIQREEAGQVIDGNFVVIASGRPIDTASLNSPLSILQQPAVVVENEALTSLVKDVTVLTDDYAPADQLLAKNLHLKPTR